MKGKCDYAEVFDKVLPTLDEKARRLFVGGVALIIGISAASRASKMVRNTIKRGIRDMNNGEGRTGRIRKVGAGRRRAEKAIPTLSRDLTSIVEVETRGDPESPLLWTSKSTRAIKAELYNRSILVSHETIARCLKEQGYSLQGCRKTKEGRQHPDRDAQFKYIAATVSSAMDAAEPVISVDTKKKELVGNYANKGQRWRQKGDAPKVNGHDFPDPDVPRAYPYGIYDIKRNTGFVNVGTDHDTAEFAVASILGWWREEGRALYPDAKRITITADGGGSNSGRSRLWKFSLRKFALETGLTIRVLHFPPGTSKWNKIEHRLFSFISSNWRGQPLLNYETIVNLIAHTTTAKGLKVICRLDRRAYQVGRIVTKQENEAIRIARNEFHGEWNYEILPL